MRERYRYPFTSSIPKKETTLGIHVSVKTSSCKGFVVFSNAARSFRRCGGREPSTHVSPYASSMTPIKEDGDES
jgi:hypothetical protein